MALACFLVVFGYAFPDIAARFLWPVLLPTLHVRADVLAPFLTVTTVTVGFAFLAFGLALCMVVTYRDLCNLLFPSDTCQQFARHTRRSWLRWLVRRRRAHRFAVASSKWEQ